MSVAPSPALRHSIGGLVKTAVLVVLIASAWRAGDQLLGVLDASRSSGVLFHGTLAAAMVAYVALMVLPFCPGIEVASHWRRGSASSSRCAGSR